MDGTLWGELLGCSNTALGIRDQIVKSHSPLLHVTDSVWIKICAPVQESRGTARAMRPRLEGGMRWCPKDLGCVVQDLFQPSTEQSRSAALSQHGASFSDHIAHMANAAGVQRLQLECSVCIGTYMVRAVNMWFALAPYEAFTALHMS